MPWKQAGASILEPHLAAMKLSLEKRLPEISPYTFTPLLAQPKDLYKYELIPLSSIYTTHSLENNFTCVRNSIRFSSFLSL